MRRGYINFKYNSSKVSSVKFSRWKTIAGAVATIDMILFGYVNKKKFCTNQAAKIDYFMILGKVVTKCAFF
jgi:hypothetical protein